MTKEELETAMAKAKASIEEVGTFIKALDDEALADEIEEIQTELQTLLECIEETLDGYSE